MKSIEILVATVIVLVGVVFCPGADKTKPMTEPRYRLAYEKGVLTNATYLTAIFCLENRSGEPLTLRSIKVGKDGTISPAEINFIVLRDSKWQNVGVSPSVVSESSVVQPKSVSKLQIKIPLKEIGLREPFKVILGTNYESAAYFRTEDFSINEVGKK